MTEEQNIQNTVAKMQARELQGRLIEELPFKYNEAESIVSDVVSEIIADLEGDLRADLSEELQAYARGEDWKNLIDYPCSPEWVHHYAQQGMTPDYPSDFYREKKVEAPLLSPKSKWSRGQWAAVAKVRTEINLLENRLNAHLDKKAKGYKGFDASSK